MNSLSVGLGSRDPVYVDGGGFGTRSTGFPYKAISDITEAGLLNRNIR
jgi:hypothetical protein